MRNIHDQFAKGILKIVLVGVARLETNREIPGHVLAADLWVEPESVNPDLAALGALGRMVASGPCLIEPFSGVPRIVEFRSCILKQYSLDHSQRRQARTAGATPPPFPLLWVIANGSPDGAIDQFELRPMEGWPAGFMTGRPCDPLHLVIIRRLPRTPETILLRLLGRRDIFQEAMSELAALPATSQALSQLVTSVRNVVFEFRSDMHQDDLEGLDEDDMEAIRDIEAAAAEWEKRMRSEGRRAAFVETIEGFCEILEIDLTDEQRAAIAGWDLAQLERVVAALRSTKRWPDAVD